MVCSPRVRRQQGFSLIVVFLIIVVMAAVAGTVMVSTQGDLQVSAHDRESAMAFYAAEAAAAYAQSWLTNSAPPTNGANVWTVVLGSGQVQLCLPSTTAFDRPGIMPDPTNTGIMGGLQQLYPNPYGVNNDTRVAWTRWCVHNNALDPSYLKAAGFPSTGDLVDSDGIITIEAYGIAGGSRNPNDPANARSWITVDVRYGVGSPCGNKIDPSQATGNSWNIVPCG